MGSIRMQKVTYVRQIMRMLRYDYGRTGSEPYIRESAMKKPIIMQDKSFCICQDSDIPTNKLQKTSKKRRASVAEPCRLALWSVKTSVGAFQSWLTSKR